MLEAPTGYERIHANRSVKSVAAYFGYDAPDYRIVDIGSDLRPMTFDRGFVQESISDTWAGADMRIVLSRLRTDPVEFAHLGLPALAGTTGRMDENLYFDRRIDYRSPTMMLLDVAPPDFAVVDGWAPVAQGPFGILGCAWPARIRHVYAGADVLAVDRVVLADLGITDPLRSPMLRHAAHWFGGQSTAPEVDGRRPDLARELRGPHSSRLLRFLGILGYPIYVYLSGRGEVFLPAFDLAAFPRIRRLGPVARGVQWTAQRVFGLHAPRPMPR